MQTLPHMSFDTIPIPIVIVPAHTTHTCCGMQLTSPIGHVLQAEGLGCPLLLPVVRLSLRACLLRRGSPLSTTLFGRSSSSRRRLLLLLGVPHLGLAAHALLGQEDHLGHGIDKGLPPVGVGDGRAGQVAGALGNVPEGVRRLGEGLALEALGGEARGGSGHALVLGLVYGLGADEMRDIYVLVFVLVFQLSARRPNK